MQVRTKKLELVGMETIMMHHSLLELMEQTMKVDQTHSVVKISCVIWPPCCDNITMYMVTLGRAWEGISHKKVGLPEWGAIQVGCIW